MTTMSPVAPPPTEPTDDAPAAAVVRPSRGRRLAVWIQHQWLALTITLILFYLIAGPVGMLVASSFQQSGISLPFGPTARWSLQNYVDVFTDPDTWSVMGTTLTYSIGALVVATVCSIGSAWLIERTDIPARRLLYVIVVTGIGIPGLVYGISWNLLLNTNNGVLNQGLDAIGLPAFNIQSIAGMIFVEGIRMTPLMFLLVSAAIRQMDGTMEDAAAASGARPRTTIRKVTVPLLMPAFAAAAIYQFVTAIETVDVPLILGLPGHVTVLSTQVYLEVHPAIGIADYGLSSTYGIMLFALAAIPLLAYQRMISRSTRYATVTGKAYRPRRKQLRSWRWPAFGLMMLYGVVTLAAPLLVMLWASTQPYFSGFSRAGLERFTLDAYKELFQSPSFTNAVWHTLVIGIMAALITMLLSLISSWVIVRSRSRTTALLDLLVFAPHLIPSVIVGLAVALIYLVMPIGIYGTIWIVIVAMVTRQIALGTRITTPGIAQIHASLEEAGAASGAPPRVVWWKILLPLLRGVIGNGTLMVFVACAQNLTLALMLVAPGNSVLATQIYNYWDLGDVPSAMGMSVILTAVTATAAVFLRGGDKDA